MPVRLYIALGVIALLGAAWWRYDSLVTKVESQANAIAGYETQVKGLKEQLDAEGKKAKAANDRLTDHLNRLKVAEDETNRLRDCVANGTCGLRIKATCPRVPQAAGEPGTSHLQSTDTELAPESRSAYFTHRQQIDKVTELLNSCVKELNARTLCY